MSRYVYEGKTKVYLVSSIADISAPTVTELNAGTDISGLLTKDGLTLPQNQNMVDSATLKETFDAQLVGSWGGSIELTCFRDDTNDEAWELFTYGLNTHLVVRRGLPVDDAWAGDQDAEVYPIQTHQPIMQSTAANEQQRFTVGAAVTAEPDLKAVVAAGS